MKICWDNIEKLRYNKTVGKWRKGAHSYIYMDSCKNCGEPYLTNSSNIGYFCDRRCSKIGKNNPMYDKKGKMSTNWKGGVKKSNIPLYDTYAHQISYAEQTRRNREDKNILEVKCIKCNNWFTPKTTDICNRIQALNGIEGHIESHLYCSNECKKSCPIYNRSIYQENHPHRPENRPYQQEWSHMVKEEANYECEICGSKENLTAHHILPVKTHPHLQADVDNGVCLCENCHKDYGHKDECSTGKLSSMVC